VNSLDPETYCREIESYLCRKNDGHLIRIVGPAFEQVCGWATRGVPLTVAHRGIDRYFERYYAKGPRRRPVRVEFCEADVLDVFDEWRRAVGVPATRLATAGPDAMERPEESGGRHQSSLPVHLDRVIARLTSMRAGEDRSLDDALDAIVRELDAARAGARSLRGDARARLLDRLRELDAELLAAVRARCDDATLRELHADATAQLVPFRERMPPDAYDRSRAACVERGIRERFRLPVIAYEPDVTQD
jgi:hypothetical protein